MQAGWCRRTGWQAGSRAGGGQTGIQAPEANKGNDDSRWMTAVEQEGAHIPKGCLLFSKSREGGEGTKRQARREGGHARLARPRSGSGLLSPPHGNVPPTRLKTGRRHNIVAKSHRTRYTTLLPTPLHELTNTRNTECRISECHVCRTYIRPVFVHFSLLYAGTIASLLHSRY